MGQYLAAYLGAGAAFLILDLVWLGVIARSFYANQMGALLAPSFNMRAAVAFYVIYLIGLLVFVLSPTLAAGGGVGDAALRGALFGLFCYATYDLTGLAVIRGFPGRLAVIDIIWGAILTAVAAACGLAAAGLAG